MAITVYNGPLGTYSAKSRTSGTDQVQAVEIDDLAVQIDEGATYTYIGYAAPGTLTAAATWKIKRMTNARDVIGLVQQIFQMMRDKAFLALLIKQDKREICVYKFR